MKRLIILAAFLFSGVVFTALAQPCPPDCPMKKGEGEEGMKEGRMQMRHEMMQERRMHRMHMMGMMGEDVERTTVRGRVASIEPRPMGAVVMVESDSRLVPVFLGPGWGKPDEEWKVQPNDMVEVTGKRIMRDGQPVVMAGMIKVDAGDSYVILRPERTEDMDREGPPEGEHPGPPENRPAPRPMKMHSHAY